MEEPRKLRFVAEGPVVKLACELPAHVQARNRSNWFRHGNASPASCLLRKLASSAESSREAGSAPSLRTGQRAFGSLETKTAAVDPTPTTDSDAGHVPDREVETRSLADLTLRPDAASVALHYPLDGR